MQCKMVDVNIDKDGLHDCFDGCPGDPSKTALGACRCNMEEKETSSDIVFDCSDETDKDKQFQAYAAVVS